LYRFIFEREKEETMVNLNAKELEMMDKMVNRFFETEDDMLSDNDDLNYFEVFKKKDDYSDIYKPMLCVDGVVRGYEGD
jgi:hypothetical protein